MVGFLTATRGSKGLVRGAAASGDLFAPVLAMFGSGEQGWIYDELDPSTLFKDVSGLDPVTAFGDAVQRQNDLSGNGNHRTQTVLAGRPLYRAVGLEWDDVDDNMKSTATVDFTGTDKIAVFIGLTKDTDAGAGMLVELSASVTANAGSFYVLAPEDGTLLFTTIARGSAAINANQRADAVGAPWAAPVSVVLTAIHDIAGDSTILRLNGTQIAEAVGDKGTGNFRNDFLYFGRRGGSSLPFGGDTHRSVGIGRLPTAQEIIDTEAWIAAGVP